MRQSPLIAFGTQAKSCCASHDFSYVCNDYGKGTTQANSRDGGICISLISQVFLPLMDASMISYLLVYPTAKAQKPNIIP